METLNNQFENLRKANFNLNYFYNVTLTEYKIKLQGALTSDTRKYCESLGFKFELCEADWLKAAKDNVEIILTF
jgi:hypothetical protein